MTKNKHLGRKPNRIVRRPATRFAHIQKRMRKLAALTKGRQLKVEKP